MVASLSSGASAADGFGVRSAFVGPGGHLAAALHIWNIIAASIWYSIINARMRHIRDKDQSGVLVAFLICGVLSMGIAGMLYWLYPPALVRVFSSSAVAYHVLVVGLAEEAAKFAAFWLAIRSVEAIREPQDGVLFGAIVGLAFGSVENIGYIQQFQSWSIGLRPLLSTPGHAIYGAIWGGLYSQAVYANAIGDDPGARRNALIGVPLVALFHGLYNSFGGFNAVGFLLDAVALAIAIALFSRLVEMSPYRIYKLHEYQTAIPSIRRGIVFNHRSPVLNKNLGLYLMHQGDLKAAAAHLRLSVPRARDPRHAQFLAAACETTFVPRPQAVKFLRIAWARLTDSQRVRSVAHLKDLVGEDSETFSFVDEFVRRAEGPRKYVNTRDLATELKLRKLKTR